MDFKNENRPGRPENVNRARVIELFKKHEKLIYVNKKVISKVHPIWQELAGELNGKLSSRSLYSLACAEKHKVLENDISIDNNISIDLSFQEKSSLFDDSDLKENIEQFSIFVSEEEFLTLVERKQIRRADRPHKKNSLRSCFRLRKGLWQAWLTHELWKAVKLQCGFRFKYHYLNENLQSGKLKGHCTCGSQISCAIVNSDNGKIQIECSMLRGTEKGKCGKRYLREPIRSNLAEKLKFKSTVVLRSEEAATLMDVGDDEPPHLYSSCVLKVAKNEFVASNHVHQDPLIALGIMKNKNFKGSIHSIGFDPFFVFFWNNNQTHVYCSSVKQGHVTLCIDATGSLIQKIKKYDGSNSQHIFLYNGVIHTGKLQFPVMQMISEVHNTNIIEYWLNEWVRLSSPPIPKEVVCDSSRALLTSTVRSFTGFLTIEEYSESYWSEKSAKCYIRIDVAHFIKIYANFLSKVNIPIKRFYLALIGQLVLCQDIKIAADILYSIFLICQCTTGGSLRNGKLSSCSNEKIKMRKLLDPAAEEGLDNVVVDFPPEDDSIFSSINKSSNRWTIWGEEINLKVLKVAQAEEGDDDNAHYFPELAKKLIDDLQWMPLWSCMARPKFGYGRIPASSAPVEGHFSILKNQIFKFCSKPIRADNFIENYLNYLEGNMKIVTSELNHLTEQDNFDNDEEIEEVVLATHEEENWKGLIVNKNEKPTSLYLTKNYDIYDSLNEYKKLHKIPIIKNGHNPSLRAISIDGKFYSLKNTCGFDSLLQIFLVGVRDNEEVRSSFQNLASIGNRFADMVTHISSKGINTNSYRRRTMILKDVFETTTTQIIGNNYLIDCECNVVSLISKLFEDYPTLREVSLCETGCPPKNKNLRVVSIDSASMMEDSEFIIEKHIVLRGKQKCYNCNGYRESKLTETGQYFFVEPVNLKDQSSLNISLEDIPKSFSDPLSDKKFYFLGLVNFIPGTTTRKEPQMNMGHYTGILARSSFWVEYNDLSNKEKKINKSKIKVNPHLLLYFKK